MVGPIPKGGNRLRAELRISGRTHFAASGRMDATPPTISLVSLLHKRAIVVDELCAIP
jgi:hypothetical protein